jgi:uncharacterized protein (DUF1330 family)
MADPLNSGVNSMSHVKCAMVAAGLTLTPLVWPANADEGKAYLVGLVNVENKDWIAEYRPKTAELLKKYGANILARGAPAVVLEGDAPDADAILIVEFPSLEEARTWYADPEYQPLIELRQSGSVVDFVLIQALK